MVYLKDQLSSNRTLPSAQGSGSHPSICPEQYLASFHFWVANNPVLFTQLVRLMDPPTFSEHPHHCNGGTEVQGLSRFTGLSFSESLALCCLGAPGDPLSNPRSPHPTAPSPVFLSAPVSPVLPLIVARSCFAVYCRASFLTSVPTQVQSVYNQHAPAISQSIVRNEPADLC